MSANIMIRKAETGDAPVIAGFNRAMALETEGKKLLPDIAERGVAGLLSRPEQGFYVVAQVEGETVASLMVTTEWSDWRNGAFWWIQSVYVVPQWRRRGVYTALYDFIRQSARGNPDVCGFRLYVEKDNLAARQTYRALGMVEADYRIFEELKPQIRYCE